MLLDRVPRHMLLPQQAPFLFRMGAQGKSSDAVLTACLQSSLCGIGKLDKYLGKLCYRVDYVQRDVDEWPMSVSSISHDLANGIILCKLVSLLFGEVRGGRLHAARTAKHAHCRFPVWTRCHSVAAAAQDIMSGVRNPTAAQRGLRARNVRLAIEAAARGGVDTRALSADRGEGHAVVDVQVEDIVSGHCREVLALLWGIALESFARTLPLPALQTEVMLTERKLRGKGLTTLLAAPGLLPGNDLPVTQLLFRWVRSVCGVYGVTVRNCSSSFTDGAALCLLVHYYVPSLVSWSAINILPPVAREVAEQVLEPHSGLGSGMESLSWCDYIGLQNSVDQGAIEQHRCGFAQTSRTGAPPP